MVYLQVFFVDNHVLPTYRTCNVFTFRCFHRFIPPPQFNFNCLVVSRLGRVFARSLVASLPVTPQCTHFSRATSSLYSFANPKSVTHEVLTQLTQTTLTVLCFGRLFGCQRVIYRSVIGPPFVTDFLCLSIPVLAQLNMISWSDSSKFA